MATRAAVSIVLAAALAGCAMAPEAPSRYSIASFSAASREDGELVRVDTFVSLAVDGCSEGVGFTRGTAEFIARACGGADSVTLRIEQPGLSPVYVTELGIADARTVLGEDAGDANTTFVVAFNDGSMHPAGALTQALTLSEGLLFDDAHAPPIDTEESGNEFPNPSVDEVFGTDDIALRDALAPYFARFSAWQAATMRDARLRTRYPRAALSRASVVPPELVDGIHALMEASLASLRGVVATRFRPAVDASDHVLENLSAFLDARDEEMASTSGAAVEARARAWSALEAQRTELVARAQEVGATRAGSWGVQLPRIELSPETPSIAVASSVVAVVGSIALQTERDQLTRSSASTGDSTLVDE